MSALAERTAPGELRRAVRAVLDASRAALLDGRPADTDIPSIALAVRQRVYERSLPRLRRVINATGVILHTGLGRAPLAEAALDAIVAVARGYCNLEYDLASGQRGDRHEHVRELLTELTGAEDALVVNNCAAATLLALHALAAGGEVVVSRGQLVEIGGSYRLPDIMAAAGCRLVEVGTTNRTRRSDYERAAGDATRALMRVHTSNYRIVGFTESVAADVLAALARERGLVFIDDVGSGLLDQSLLQGPGAAAGEDDVALDADDALEAEPVVAESVAAGADVVLFSGDKLLGGPQAGVIVGSAALIARIRRDPLARAMRPDKLTLAALEATLRLHRDAAASAQIPLLTLLHRPIGELAALADRLGQALCDAIADVRVAVGADHNSIGGGSLPGRLIETRVVALTSGRAPAAAIAAALRTRETPIVSRVRDDAVIFDLRTIAADEVDEIIAAVCDVVADAAPAGDDGAGA